MGRALQYFVGSVAINIIGLAILNWLLTDFSVDNWWGWSGWRS